jgi:hypothetical protein
VLQLDVRLQLFSYCCPFYIKTVAIEAFRCELRVDPGRMTHIELIEHVHSKFLFYCSSTLTICSLLFVSDTVYNYMYECLYIFASIIGSITSTHLAESRRRIRRKRKEKKERERERKVANGFFSYIRSFTPDRFSNNSNGKRERKNSFGMFSCRDTRAKKNEGTKMGHHTACMQKKRTESVKKMRQEQELHAK